MAVKIRSLLLFSALAALGPALAALPTVTVRVSSTAPANATHVIPDNFIGISYELSSFDTLWGTTPKTMPVAMQNYMHNLVARLSKPLRIRLGGNGMDGSTYMRSLNETMLEHIDPDAYFNDIPVHFGPVIFDVLNAMYEKVGPMQFMIGLSMRDGHDFTNIVELAQDATSMLGSRLDVMLLGNEPDLYAGHGERDAYEIEDYIPELGTAIEALTEGGALTRGVPMIGGPTICCGWTLIDILNAGMDQYEYKYYTLQRYPNHACSGVNERNTNMTYYLTHANVGPYLTWNSEGQARAKELGVPILMTEYNSVACGGSPISDMFVMSLWAVDVGLKAASLEYEAVYLHTRELGIQYNLFDPPSAERSLEAGWRTGSPYYAALFLAELTSPNGNLVVDLNINNSTTNANATAAGYAVYSGADRTIEKFVFLNFNESDSQPFRIPANLTEKIEYRVLTAPSVRETKDIKWAGQTIGDLGNLEGDQETVSMFCQEGCVVDVPGPGAALVVLGDSVTLFSGNSTLVGSLSVGEESGAGRVAGYSSWIGLAGAAAVSVVATFWT
ncbi:hypothetical protein H1R20_g3964, partial [Candolleomyces eurysporus]